MMIRSHHRIPAGYEYSRKGTFRQTKHTDGTFGQRVVEGD